MKNWIHDLEISNYKNLGHVHIQPKRINLILGKPNVGKSNLLEAIGLLGLGQLSNTTQTLDDEIRPSFSLDKFSKTFRFEDTSNLFHYNSLSTPIVIKSNIANLALRYIGGPYDTCEAMIHNDFSVINSILQNNASTPLINSKLIYGNEDPLQIEGLLPVSPNYYVTFQMNTRSKGHSNTNTNFIFQTPIRNYHFDKKIFKEDGYINYSRNHLSIPDGNNLFSIIESNSIIRNFISGYFNEYDLDIVMDVKNKKIEIQRRVNNFVYKIPYYLIADTLLRLIFYTSAILSNKDSVIILEEPETHSFPPYLAILNQHILDSASNQFFIATHNPYIVTGLLENSDLNDISVFVMDHKGGEATIRQISESGHNKIIDSGMSVFFDLENLK